MLIGYTPIENKVKKCPGWLINKYVCMYMIYFFLQSDCFRIRLEVHIIPPGSNRLMFQQRVLKEGVGTAGPAAEPRSGSRSHLPHSPCPHCPPTLSSPPQRSVPHPHPPPPPSRGAFPACCPSSHEPLRGVQGLAHHQSPNTPTGVQPKLRAQLVGLLTYG